MGTNDIIIQKLLKEMSESLQIIAKVLKDKSDKEANKLEKGI